MSFSKDEHAVGNLAAGGEDEPFGVGVRSRASWWDLADGDAGIGQHGVEGGGELPGPVTDEDLELVGAVAQGHEQIPGLLDGPRPVRVGGYAEDVHVAAADLEHEEHVQALQGERTVDMEKVAGEHGGCLGGKESSPRGVVAADGRRWNTELAGSWRRRSGDRGRVVRLGFSGSPSRDCPGPSARPGPR